MENINKIGVKLPDNLRIPRCNTLIEDIELLHNDIILQPVPKAIMMLEARLDLLNKVHEIELNYIANNSFFSNSDLKGELIYTIDKYDRIKVHCGIHLRDGIKIRENENLFMIQHYKDKRYAII
jgi:hypothetical protein